jgi:thermitase
VRKKLNSRFWAVVAVIVAAALLLPQAGTGPALATDEFVPGEVLVKFRPGTPAAEAAAAHRQAGGQPQEVIPGIDVQVVRVPPGRERAAVEAYRRNPNVVFAEVNGFYAAIWTPNDPYYGQQWQYPKIQAPDAWAVVTGTSQVAIAILDTGIDQSHEDLRSKVAQNVNFTTSGSFDDKYGHGTHVAGSAAAATNNGLGVAGTCPNCALYNVKVLGDNGSGAWSWIASGIVWAADNGARVINMSLGGPTGSSTVEEAVNYAWNTKKVVLAAAGNSNTDSPLYPAYYSYVIAVAATDHDDNKASFSNYGTWVDIAAPGVSILSTAPDHRNRIWVFGVKYATGSGTSMATPHVAGTAGLVWSTGACGTNSCVRSRIEQGADKIPGTGTYWTNGRLNAYNAVMGLTGSSP